MTSHVVIVAILHATQPHVMADPTLDDNDIFAHNVITSDLPTESECIMRRSYHVVRVNLARLSRDSETIIGSYDTYESARYTACYSLKLPGEHMVVRHMGLVVWDSEAAKEHAK